MPPPSAALQGALDLLILKTLARAPNHGFSIALHIQSASQGLLRVEEGSLYPALHRLERDKLVAGEWKVTEKGRRARYYKLMRGWAANGLPKPNNTGPRWRKALPEY